MKIITLLAQKGGTGKTTLAIHLAALAAGSRARVLLADTDPQGSALLWSNRRTAPLPKVLPFTIRKLKKDLTPLQESGAELIFIDTPPHSTDDAYVAARLSDFILIPSRPAILDLAAIDRSVSIVRKTGKPGGIILNCCPPPSRYGETAIVKDAREALKIYDLPIAPTIISQRVAFSHALVDGMAVTEFERNGKAAREISQLWEWLLHVTGYEQSG